MTKEQKQKYLDPEILRKILSQFNGMKFRLHCGHHLTFGYHLGNDITIINGKDKGMRIICSDCG